ncbi:MAG: AraC family transcriptional regulator [Sulfuritalea sp.]|nr:AraC family transcriptional regulator [Sulfuritalea sp.]
MDVLSDVLTSIHLGGGVHFRCEMSAPWGIAMPPAPVAEFHVIVRGNGWLRIPDRAEPVAIQGGDVIAFLHGGAHGLVDAPDGEARPVGEILEGQSVENFGPVTHGGGGQRASILCGYFEFDRDSLHPLVAALPPVIHLRGAEISELAWLQTALNFMIHETLAAKPGAEAVVGRLAGVLFVLMVRAYLEQSESPPAMLAAIADKQVGAALALMHKDPAQAWTLDTLARGAGMSRSALSARFHQLVGNTPIQYLTMWRMQQARKLLRESTSSMAAIAERVGYQSEAAFSKAFKKAVGTGPGAYRRERAQ